jgi:mono/diheme cytochrome c family protein
MKKHLVYGSGVFAFILTTAGSAAEAPATWGQNCAACHGSDGAAHTKAAKMLGSKDLTDAGYQKTFTDDQAFAAIKDGYKDAGGKEKMKPFGDRLKDDEIKALVAYVRTLAK